MDKRGEISISLVKKIMEKRKKQKTPSPTIKERDLKGEYLIYNVHYPPLMRRARGRYGPMRLNPINDLAGIIVRIVVPLFPNIIIMFPSPQAQGSHLADPVMSIR